MLSSHTPGGMISLLIKPPGLSSSVEVTRIRVAVVVVPTTTESPCCSAIARALSLTLNCPGNIDQ